MAFPLIIGLILAAAGTAVQAKAQADAASRRNRKLRQGQEILDRDTRKAEANVRKTLDKVSVDSELELAQQNDTKNAETLARVATDIRPARTQERTGFKGNVSNKSVKTRERARLADAAKFKEFRRQTGAFASNSQTQVDKGEIFSDLAVRNQTQRGFTRGNQRVNQIQLNAIRANPFLTSLGSALKIGGSVVGFAGGAAGSVAAPTTRIAAGNQLLLPASRTGLLNFGAGPSTSILRDPSNLFGNF